MSLSAAARKRPAAMFPRIVCAPSRVEFVETQWVCTIQAFPVKKQSKCQAGFSWRLLTAPSNQFSLMKHIKSWELYWKDVTVPAARRATADSGVTAQSVGLNAGGGVFPLVSAH